MSELQIRDDHWQQLREEAMQSYLTHAEIVQTDAELAERQEWAEYLATLPEPEEFPWSEADLDAWEESRD